MRTRLTLFSPLLSSLLLSVLFRKPSSNATKECESEISSKSLIVSKLEQKTLDISNMLVRMQERGMKQSEDAKNDPNAKKKDQS